MYFFISWTRRPALVGGRQGVDDVDGGGEADAEAGAGRRRSPGRWPSGSCPGRRRRPRCIGLVLDELEAEEILDGQAVDLGRPGEVELVEGLEHGEAGLLDAAWHAPVLAWAASPSTRRAGTPTCDHWLAARLAGQGLDVFLHERQVQDSPVAGAVHRRQLEAWLWLMVVLLGRPADRGADRTGPGWVRAVPAPAGPGGGSVQGPGFGQQALALFQEIGDVLAAEGLRTPDASSMARAVGSAP